MLRAIFYPGDVPFDTLFIPSIFYEIYYDSIYLDVLNVLDKEKKNPVIVDVGANIGLTVNHFLDHAAKIYAIEPASENFEALKQTKEFNHWDKVEIFKTAIWVDDRGAELRIYSKNHTSNSIVFRDEIDRDFEKVPTITINNFLKDNKIKHVDFMKFDVEGAEKKILMSKDFDEASKIIDNIMVEFHFPDFPEQVNHLISLGYKARRYPCSATVIDFSR
jgi:FkbM family methyltransferase